MAEKRGGGWRMAMAAGVLVATTTLGAGGGGVKEIKAIPTTGATATKTPRPTFTPLPTETEVPTVTATPSPTETPRPTATPTEVLTEQEVEGVIIIYDSKGIPLTYQIPGGAKVSFDYGEMVRARERALMEKEFQATTTIDIPAIKWKNAEESGEDRLLCERLPEDVADEEYLRVHGVQIIQGREVDVHIRRSAFEEGGPLAAMGGKKLIIGVIDETPYISPYSLDEERFKPIKLAAAALAQQGEIVIPSVGDFKQQELASIDSQLREARERKSPAIVIEDLKISQKVLQEASDEELKLMIGDKYAGWGGVMISPKTVEAYVGTENTAIILFAAGNSHLKNMLVVGVGPDGKFTVGYMPWKLPGTKFLGGGPGINQSRPRRSDFMVADKGSVYLIDGLRSPGQILEHELGHYRRLILSPTGDDEADRNERQTDELTLREMQDAYESGKPEGYYIFLKVPERGYILTRNERTDGALV